MRATKSRFFEALNPAKDNTKGFISCADILSWGAESAFNQYVSYSLSNKNDPDYAIKERNLERLRARFWEDQAFSCGVYDANEMQDALEIFILSNNTGKPLDKADLIIATLTTSWNKISANEEIDSLVTELNRQIPSKRPFTKKSLIKSFLAIAPVNLPISHSIKRVTPTVISALEEFWPQFSAVMIKTVKLVKNWNLHQDKSLSSVNALIPISYSLLVNDINIDKEDLNTIKCLSDAKTWLYSALFSGSFGGKSDQAISDARDAVTAYQGIGFPIRELNIALNEHHNFDLLSRRGIENFIESLSYESISNKGVIMLVLKLIRGQLKDTNYQLDHIYPQSNDFYIGEMGVRRLHKIENLELLTSVENKVKNNQSPQMLWNNEQFDDKWWLDNQLPAGIEIQNTRAIYDEPVRLLDYRKEKILTSLIKKLNIEN